MALDKSLLTKAKVLLPFGAVGTTTGIMINDNALKNQALHQLESQEKLTEKEKNNWLDLLEDNHKLDTENQVLKIKLQTKEEIIQSLKDQNRRSNDWQAQLSSSTEMGVETMYIATV